MGRAHHVPERDLLWHLLDLVSQQQSLGGVQESRISPFTSLVLLNTTEAVVGYSGVQLAPDKIEGPTTVVTFLGIVIDLVQMECRLQDDSI